MYQLYNSNNVLLLLTALQLLTPSLPSAHTQRLLKLQSILRRAPSYRTLELQLIEWQERELFEYFVVVSLKKKPSKNAYAPEVTYQFPKVKPGFWFTLMFTPNITELDSAPYHDSKHVFFFSFWTGISSCLFFVLFLFCACVN